MIMLKSVARQMHKLRRLALSQEVLHRQSQQLIEIFWQSHFLENTKVLHIFLPIRKFNEPDTWLLVEKIWAEKPAIRLAVSKTNLHTQTLSHYFLEKDTRLQENEWGILEPEASNSQICLPSEIDTVLVPMLAFDARGYRVGYGKGFYDKFLAQCPQATKVGFSLEEMLPEPLSDIGEHDIRLDYCVTPSQVFSFVKS